MIPLWDQRRWPVLASYESVTEMEPPWPCAGSLSGFAWVFFRSWRLWLFLFIDRGAKFLDELG